MIQLASFDYLAESMNSTNNIMQRYQKLCLSRLHELVSIEATINSSKNDLIHKTRIIIHKQSSIPTNPKENYSISMEKFITNKIKV